MGLANSKVTQTNKHIALVFLPFHAYECLSNYEKAPSQILNTDISDQVAQRSLS